MLSSQKCNVTNHGFAPEMICVMILVLIGHVNVTLLIYVARMYKQ